ncbi:DUF5675 family protein [Flavobacterium oreochromis]|uniref:DUF5675 family protein n=1 Tax=Flavobacterium oreochromis TaxID=2906078 RepID=A0ABW8P6N8_9FLAO|nr:DUF5675 family protein [Flavobacterium oreochromis]
MSNIEQLDYVKKYFQLYGWYKKINKPEEIYLQVFAPKGISKGDDYVLYQEIQNPKTKLEIKSNSGYLANKSVDEENNNDKKIQKFEILARYNQSFDEGSKKINIVKKSSNSNVIIRLVRKWQTNNSTIGEFTIDGSDIKGYMLEEKGPDTTLSGIERRIPIGTYNLVWHYGSKFKGVLKVYNNQVSQDRAILIHAGNTALQTEGCILPGSIRDKDFVGDSRKKLKEIINYVKEKGIEGAKLIITENYE